MWDGKLGIKVSCKKNAKLSIDEVITKRALNREVKLG
jgi:hypothetical protein